MAEAKWRRYVRFWRTNVDADVDDELRFHFAERIEALVAAGLTIEDARHTAGREFGNVNDVRQRLREIDQRVHAGRTRRSRWEAWKEDLEYAARSLRRSPGLATTILITLVLGIGLNATLFSLLDRVFLRMPSGIASPGQLHRLYWTGRGMSNEPIALPSFSIPLADAVNEAVRGIATLTVYQPEWRRFGDEDKARTVVTSVDGRYFSLLGARPAFGRFFTSEEERIDAVTPVAVVGEGFWRQRFRGSAADAVGQTIVVDKRRLTVIGVAPSNFTGPDLDATDIWIPLGMLTSLPPYDTYGGDTPWYRTTRLFAFQVLARPMHSGEQRLEAQATVGVRRAFADDKFHRTSRILTGPLPASRGPASRQQEASIAIRLGGVAVIVLLIACANIANLLLARSVQRRREIAVRAALGIGRSGIVRLFLAESLLLAVIAGVAALLVAGWAGALLRVLLFPSEHWSSGVLDWRVGAFTLGITLLAGLAAGLAPAIRASRTDISQTLKAAGREGSAHRSHLRIGLVVTQAALSTVLLVGAALFVKSLHAVRALDLGFDVQRLVFVSVSFDGGEARRNEALLEAGLPDLAARLARIPGVERVALSSMAPMYGFGFSSLYYASGDTLPGWSDGAPGVTAVSPDFFAATGLKLLRGRALTESDMKAGDVAVVNQTLARTVWPHEQALGQCLRVGKASAPCVTIIGVVADARRSQLLENPVRQLYLPLVRGTGTYSVGSVIVRAPPERAAAVEIAARREVAAKFPGAEAQVLRMSEILAPQYRPWQLGATLFSVFGLLALIVAAVGVFSTLSHDISQRRHELGVRAALGAGIADIVRLVIGNGLRVVIAGAAIGSLLALAGGRLVASLLYGVAPRDPIVLASVVAVLIVVAVLASAAPAWRASRADPMDALRAE